MPPVLSRLTPVPLTEIWETEAQHFTPWLAGEDNLALLGETLGMELEHEATEKSVGPFRADILCKDLNDDSWVLIENQLGRTDHTHLGQLMTYAAGLKTVTIVWIAARFTEEHRAALDWLNAITQPEFRFFGLEIEVWRMGEDGPAAPKFNLVSKPNEWSKSVSQGRRDIDAADLSGVKAAQLDYWTAFAEALTARSGPLRPQKPHPQHWMNLRIGRSGFLISGLVNSQKKTIAVELLMTDDNAKAYFHLLKSERAEIEAELAARGVDVSALNWMELPHRKFSRLLLTRADTDFTRRGDWTEQHAWMIDQLESFYAVFSDRIRQLDAEDWDGQDEDSRDLID